MHGADDARFNALTSTAQTLMQSQADMINNLNDVKTMISSSQTQMPHQHHPGYYPQPQHYQIPAHAAPINTSMSTSFMNGIPPGISSGQTMDRRPR